MYKNLEAELRRKNIRREDLANILSKDVSTVSAKLNSENRLKMCEAKLIQCTLFPELSLEYLFATADNT